MLHAIRTGTITSIETGLPHRSILADERQLLHDSAAEREDLALDSIARAIPRFMTSLKDGRWDPSKGRSLRSYFICACAQAFWREYEIWSAKRHRQLRAIAYIASTVTTHSAVADELEDQFGRLQAVEVLIAKAGHRSPELEAILRCLLSGMTAAETASKLGYSERAVEGRLYHFRKMAWDLVRA
jgi:DNA-directed RNA polymerase specialized sigma24 family protein